MQTIVYTVTITTDDDVTGINAAIERAVTAVANDLDPHGTAFMSIDVTDGDGETVTGHLFDPQDYAEGNS